MHNFSIKLFVTTAFLLLCLSCAGSRPQRSADELPALLAQLPADDPETAEWIEQAILEMPPGTVQALCLRLQPPGGREDLATRYALSGLAKHVSAPGRKREQRRFSGEVTTALQAEMPATVKTFLIEQLQQAGDETAAPALAVYLDHPQLAAPAARALVSIGGKPALEALLRALADAAFPMRGHIIAALGMMGSSRATEPLLLLAESDHAPTRQAALLALADIGDPAAEAFFTRFFSDADSSSRREATAHYLRFARHLGEKGRQRRSAALSRQLLAAPALLHPAEYSDALHLLADMAGADALPELLAAADHSDQQVRAAALEIARQIPGKRITASWVEKMNAAPPGIRPEVLEMLGRRGDPAALAAILAQTADPAPDVRLTALEAAVRLDRTAGLNALLNLLTTLQDPAETQQVRQIFQTSYGAAGLQRLAETIDRASPPGQVMILELIGEREAAAFRETVRAKTVSADRKVRLAAIRAFGHFATPADRPEMLALLNKAPNAAEQSALQKLLASASRQESNENVRLAPFLAELQTADTSQKERVLPILATLGGRPALEAVIAATNAPHPDVADAAVRALADWPDPAALEMLLQLAQSSDQETRRVLALRGFIRLTGTDTSAARPLRINRYQTALNLAGSTAEKRLVLAGIAELPAPETLKMAGNLLNDPELQAEAAAAILKMADQESSQSQAQLEILLQRIAESATDESMRARALKQLGAIASRQSAPGDTTASETDSLSGKQPRYTGEDEFHNQPPEGFTALFNGEDLFGWKGLVENPPARRAMTAAALADKQAEADSIMRRHWRAEAGELRFDGEGFYNICTAKAYRNFELRIDWKIGKNGDSGIYLRGCPQVQIWDPEQWQIGSGGLYNNQEHPKDPPVIADNPTGEWNRFRILMEEDRVTVYLNNILVVDDVVLENYWERGKALYPFGQIELQAHKSPLAFRNIFIREIDPAPARTVALLNGRDLHGWQVIGGAENSWGVEDSLLYTTGNGSGWLATEREYGDFRLELDFRLPPGGNSGVFLRAPREGDPAYQGMEIQVLDDRAPQYASLKPWQYCGSLYAVQPPAQRVSKPAGEWQHYEITCQGPEVRVKLNDELIIDVDLIDHMEKTAKNPGLQRRKGFIGLQNHGDRVEYRNIRITEL